jgi:hypothetical protein
MEQEEWQAEEPPGWRPAAVALVATLIQALGLGGAVIGVYVAKNGPATPKPTVTADAAGLNTAPPSPTVSPSATESPSPSPDVTASSTSEDFQLPDVIGMEFRLARQKLRALKLGVNVRFTSTLPGDYTVKDTNPRPYSQVHKGITVTLSVPGTPALVTVPDVLGLPCAQAAAQLVEAGLSPRYPSKRLGTVRSQDPLPTATSVHWNDKVTIGCVLTAATPS